MAEVLTRFDNGKCLFVDCYKNIFSFVLGHRETAEICTILIYLFSP